MKIINQIKEFIYSRLKKSFSRYPVTMTVMVAISIVLAILTDTSFENFSSRLLCFLSLLLCGTLLFETWQESRNKRFAGIGLSATAALILTFVLFTEESFLFGLPRDIALETLWRPLGCLLTGLILYSVYRMYSRSGMDFETYCAAAMAGIGKTTVVYGLFAIGLALIVWIFYTLILESDEYSFLLRVEAFLPGILYYPGVLLALSEPKKAGNFFRNVMVYALLTMETIAFAIIYIYIAKIILEMELPRNMVFGILAGLFFTGLPIWTMAISFKELTLAKLAKFLPILFTPFTVLQGICLYIRISQYGLTFQRYLGILLLLFEAAYLILFIRKRGQNMHNIVYIAFAFLLAALCIPGINGYYLVTKSHRAVLEDWILKQQTGEKDLAPENAENVRQLARLYDAYHLLDREGGLEGYLVLRSLDEKQKAYLDSLSKYQYEPDEAETDHASYVVPDEYSIWLYDNMDNVDISAYHRLRLFNSFKQDLSEEQLSHYLLEMAVVHEETAVIYADSLTGKDAEEAKGSKNAEEAEETRNTEYSKETQDTDSEILEVDISAYIHELIDAEYAAVMSETNRKNGIWDDKNVSTVMEKDEIRDSWLKDHNPLILPSGAALYIEYLSVTGKYENGIEYLELNGYYLE